MPGNIPPESGKIEFVDSGQINEPESIDVTGAPLPKDDKYLVTVYDGDKKIDKDSFVFISSEPMMPKLRIEVYIGKDCIHKSLKFRLKIEFKFKASGTLYDRNDEDYFPSKYDGGNAFIVAKTGKNNWDVDFREMYRGGTATVEIWNEEKTSILNTFRFYIRGKNPTKEVVKKYMQDKGYLTKYWFVYKMALSESGSEGISLMKQFWDPEFVGKGKDRKEAVYGPSGRNYESKGIPNYGYPDGWGICQIDFKYEKNNLNTTTAEVKEIIKNPNYIWNWKENIAVKMNVKLPEKIAAAVNHIRRLLKNTKQLKSYSIEEGNLTYKTCPSSVPELQQFSGYLPDTSTNQNEKSILDAEIISHSLKS
ncbi:hypothetical protein NAL32_19065 [Chryseobacterium sp. Ch-15]|uniref:Uncharacterized protein n=1 Tax=Chryseobacterium muglaense TaxID=2893752 RepID=A0A9Q3YT99_9FLAO|nr:hypothetical protein [Chryseobacterium muglaense]MBD3906712.1 hypothetical protein [Chryseobacterium muglaense]MCC9036624.1 hypothetical protein [Chryseobacterium muglaense]MCM2556494.1 hypothetical protein [Chryseobacterium muglaense]